MKQGRTKFEPRADPCVFLGYPYGQKAYKVYNINTKNIIISRDVIFHEKHYPFHHKQQKTSPYATFYLPVSTPFPTDITQKSFTPPMQQGPTFYRQNSHVSPTHNNSIPHRQQDTRQQDNASLHNEHISANDNTLVVDNTNITANLCRSSRAHKQPEYLNDYICNATQWCNLVSFTTLPNFSQAFLIKQSHWSEPTSYNEAVKDKQWQVALQQELAALHQNNTWDLVC